MVVRVRLIGHTRYRNVEVVPVKTYFKKSMIAALAALMLAGGLSAISGATSVNSLHPVALVGDGSAPFPLMISANAPNSDATSLNNNF
jgi:hypothetical protein